MNTFKNVSIFLLIVIHIAFLYYFGISAFTTTFLFYYLIYLLFKKTLSFFPPEKKEILLKNVVVLLSLLLLVEFTLTFIYKQFNNGMENYRYVYFSPYKTKEQYNLLKFFRPKTTVLPLTEAYLPNSTNDIKKSEFEYLHNYNKDGFRDQKCISDADTGFYNIVFLGDSFIEGEGAPNDSTMPVLLQKKLNTDTFFGKKIKVYNCGISGSDPLSEIKLYRNKIGKLPIDMVVLCVFQNDLGDMNVLLNQDKPLPVKEYFFAISHIFRILSIPFGNYIELNADLEKLKNINAINKRLEVELYKFKKYLADKNTKLQLVYIPDYNELDKSTKLEMFNMNTEMRDNLIRVFPSTINLYLEFTRLHINTKAKYLKYYWEKNGHFNATGYNLAADVIKIKLYEIY